MNSAATPSLAEHACLALLASGLTHGWALGTALAPGGEIGAVWSLTRPLTYRAIDGLVAKGLATREAAPVGARRERQGLAATDLGAGLSQAWLDQPVERVRDVRTELLLKLALRTRSGLANGPLLVAQQATLQPRIDVLLRDSGSEPVAVWRRENARAVRRFLIETLAAEIADPAPASIDSVDARLPLSARNQLHATVAVVRRDGLVASVRATLEAGQSISATITGDAVDDLDLAVGDPVIMIMKATEVLIAKHS